MTNTALNRFLQTQKDIEGFINLFDNQIFKNQKTSALKGSLMYQPDVFYDTNDSECTINLAVPGFTKEEIKISFTENDTIRVESKLTPDQRRPFQKNFKTSLFVPSTKWDYKTVDASLENGVLTLRFQKQQTFFPEINIR
jgi:HSP20 family molecular chaperone IbpA